MRCWFLGAPAVALVGVLLDAVPASAQAEVASRRVVYVSACDVEGLDQVLEAPLAHLGLDLVVMCDEVAGLGPTPPDALARVYIVTEGTSAKAVVIDPARRRAVVRLIPLTRGYDPIVREEIATIVATSCDALTRGELIGASQGEARETAELYAPDAVEPARLNAEPTAPLPASAGPTDSLAPDGESTVSAGVELGAGAIAWRGEHLAPLVTLSGGVSRQHGPRRLGGLVLLRQAFGTGWATPLLDLELSATLLSLQGQGGWLAAPGAELSLFAGVGLELTQARANDTEPGLVSSMPKHSSSIVSTFAGRLRLGRDRRPGVALTLGTDLDFQRTDYAVSTSGGTRVVLRPWTARPWLQLGATWQG